MFSILNPAKRKKALDPVEKLTDWEQFQSRASELKFPNIQMYSPTEVDKAACDFAASVAAAYRILT
jgi:hypothetical protein